MPAAAARRAAPSACAMGACADSSACSPAVVRGVASLCSLAAGALPAKLRRRRAGCGTRDAHRYWLNVEPCGLICAGLTWAIVLYCEAAVLALTGGAWYAGARAAGAAHAVAFSTLAALALASHARAMLSNPGATPANSKPTTPAGWARTCQKCENHKPARAHHCSICGRCIVKMDHHCPWVNNCVGLANHKFFLLFLLYVCAISVYALLLVGGHFWACWAAPAGAGGSCAEPDAAQFVTVLTLCAAALLFGLFTGCMMVDQSAVVATGQTQIDRFHGAHGAAPPPPGAAAGKDERARALEEIFGGDPARDGFRWHWLLPTPIVYRDPEALTGFCFGRDVPKPRSAEEMEALL